MAKQVFTKILDDLDGSEADETVSFAIDGVGYEVDLNRVNAAELRTFLERYRDAGTRLGRSGAAAQLSSFRGRSVARSQPAVNRAQNQEVRDWARDNGYALSDRGRIPQHIVDAFRAGTPAPRVQEQRDAEQQAEKLQAEVAQPAAAARKRAPRKASAVAFKAGKAKA